MLWDRRLLLGGGVPHLPTPSPRGERGSYDAAEECPFFPGARRQERWRFPDPSAATGTEEEERLAVFRRVRDAIAARIGAFLAEQASA